MIRIYWQAQNLMKNCNFLWLTSSSLTIDTAHTFVRMCPVKLMELNFNKLSNHQNKTFVNKARRNTKQDRVTTMNIVTYHHVLCHWTQNLSKIDFYYCIASNGNFAFCSVLIFVLYAAVRDILHAPQIIRWLIFHCAIFQNEKNKTLSSRTKLAILYTVYKWNLRTKWLYPR